MKKQTTNVILGILLLLVSCAVYAAQVSFFHTPGDTLFYFLQDLAFLPVQLVLVTLLVNNLLTVREKKDRLNKMNMAVGAFFGEVGIEMLARLLPMNRRTEPVPPSLNLELDWNKRDFQTAVRQAKGFAFDLDASPENLQALKTLLLEKRQFLLLMLENPSLLEHNTFTDTLLAVFHLTDELTARESLEQLPEPDLEHLAADARRALNHLLVQWFHYAFHLQTNYPYLYSMAVRRNPFQENGSVILQSDS